MWGFLFGSVFGFCVSVFALAMFNLSKRQDEYHSMREWCSAAYSILELGVQLMPKDLLPNWTGVCCLLDSCPLEVHDYE